MTNITTLGSIGIAAMCLFALLDGCQFSTANIPDATMAISVDTLTYHTCKFRDFLGAEYQVCDHNDYQDLSTTNIKE